MSNARNLARLVVDSSGDIAASALDNVPASDDASALTTGTLDPARLPDAIDVNASAPADSLAITSGGSVGVGTTSPNQKFEVKTSSGNCAVGYNNGTYTGSIGIYSSSYGAAATGDTLVYTGSTGITLMTDNGSGVIKFAAGGSTERGRFDASGNFQFNSGYGSVATAYGCRAWVNFNGTGTVAIRASGNVSSITDNGTADYTVNFTTSMPDTNFCVTSIGSTTTDSYNGTTSLYAGSVIGGNPMTTGSVRLRCTGNGGLGNYTDAYFYCVAVFR